MALDGIIFDLDGTLLDTNDLHTKAWAEAFRSFGFHLGEDRIAIEIGKGGSMLVPTLVGDEAEKEHGEQLRERHGEVYRDLVKEGARVFPGAADLLTTCRDRGLRVAVATASEKDDLEEVIEAVDFDLFSVADEVVTDSDVDRSKPHKDVVVAAYEKLKLGPGQCAMVGDTPFDGQSAMAAGVACIGLMTGVHGEAAMWESGMRVLYRDAAHLLSNLDDALELASPGRGRLSNAVLDDLVQEAAGTAVLADSEGRILARAKNADGGHPLSHPVIDVLSAASPDVRALDDLVLVMPGDACLTCFAAAVDARVEAVVYANANENAPDAWRRVKPAPTAGQRFPRVIRSWKGG